MTHRDRKTVLFGIPVDNLTFDETLAYVGEVIKERRICQHTVLNLDKVVKSYRDDAFRQIVLGADLITVDGQPLIWASKMLGLPIHERITGIDLMERLIAESSSKGYRLYFLGAEEEVVTSVVKRYRSLYPNINIMGCRNGYWKLTEDDQVAHEIARLGADILFVALPSPRKEQFLNHWKAVMKVPFVMGVGGSFDVLSGMRKRAPTWMQRYGLEWLFRLLQEPRRLWRRYLVEDMYFWVIFLKEFWRLRIRRKTRLFGVRGTRPHCK